MGQVKAGHLSEVTHKTLKGRRTNDRLMATSCRWIRQKTDVIKMGGEREDVTDKGSVAET